MLQAALPQVSRNLLSGGGQAQTHEGLPRRSHCCPNAKLQEQQEAQQAVRGALLKQLADEQVAHACTCQPRTTSSAGQWTLLRSRCIAGPVTGCVLHADSA